MKANLRYMGNVVIVDLSGKITIGGGDVVLRESLSSLIRGRETRILVNLKDVSHIDSAGISELVDCFRKAKETECAIKLLHASEKILSLLETEQFHDPFETFRDEQEAVASF